MGPRPSANSLPSASALERPHLRPGRTRETSSRQADLRRAVQRAAGRGSVSRHRTSIQWQCCPVCPSRGWTATCSPRRVHTSLADADEADATRLSGTRTISRRLRLATCRPNERRRSTRARSRSGKRPAAGSCRPANRADASSPAAKRSWTADRCTGIGTARQQSFRDRRAVCAPGRPSRCGTLRHKRHRPHKSSRVACHPQRA